jgi:hypothetical protein
MVECRFVDVPARVRGGGCTGEEYKKAAMTLDSRDISQTDQSSHNRKNLSKLSTMSPSATETPQEVPVDIQVKKLATEVQVQSIADQTQQPISDEAVKPITDDAPLPVADEEIKNTSSQEAEPSAVQEAPAVLEEESKSLTDEAVKPIADDAAKPVTDGEVKEELPQEEKPVAEPAKPAESTNSLPELRTGHKEPLKLSGALDQFEHFDVTPVIGREYSNVKLHDLLRAPNSDELLRDLAITSKPPLFPKSMPLLTHTQSRNVVSSSSASRTRSTTTSRRNSSSAWASSPASRPPPSCTSTPSATPAAAMTRMMRSASSRLSRPRSSTSTASSARTRGRARSPSGTQTSPLNPFPATTPYYA